MKEVHVVVGIAAIVVAAAAALYGGWCWRRAQLDAASSVHATAWFWRLLRAAQAVVVLEVALGGVLALMGRKPPHLHLIYGLLPLLVSFIAESLRAASAQMVLDARGYESAHAVGKQPEEEQRAVVAAIVQREIGVMALAMLVNVVLLARAAGTA